MLYSGRSSDYVQYFDLEHGTSWEYMTDARSDNNRVSLISLSPYEAYLAGGYTSLHWGSTR